MTPQKLQEPRTAPAPDWRTTLPVRASWTFYAGPWVVILVVGLAVVVGLLLRQL